MTVTLPERDHRTRDQSDEPWTSQGERSDAERMASVVETTFDELDATAPKGWRVELIEGDIHVVPPANGDHEEIVSELLEQIGEHKAKGLRMRTGIGLRIPGEAPADRLVPDLVIAPKGAFKSPELYHDPAPVLLVCEVTSRSTGDNDRGKKLRSYARAGVPCYLLVDRQKGLVTLFSNPRRGRYLDTLSRPVGEPVPLPDPFGFEVDTSEF
ncbi:Uma2 family endonuclease [Streptomyces xiamenensis]|uniref:Uma2 family endonuclease n=1 Tax=Streptomyces TaxID=1883 RepID=UPI0019075E40|nr:MULTISPECIES: Uma2 family endonuclease [unclassified Streptomyces]MCU4747435.1 Uma2 family endonuclease [Streptomyces sp. G-5]QQN78059.1 Uma2 family endonuclease [Streptomyces sp. XC 2026]